MIVNYKKYSVIYHKVIVKILSICHVTSCMTLWYRFSIKKLCVPIIVKAGIQ